MNPFRWFLGLFRTANVEAAPRPADSDRCVIACNFVEATKSVPLGAAAYVSQLNGGNVQERIVVLVRSRSGRWVEKWEPIWRLGCFRMKKIPPAHPQYGDSRILTNDSNSTTGYLSRVSEDWRKKRGLENIGLVKLQDLRRQNHSPPGDD